MSFYTPTEADREKLKKPRGPVFSGEDFIEKLKNRDYSRLIVVGDQVSRYLSHSELRPDTYIRDGKIQREDAGEQYINDIEVERRFRTTNPPGEITEDAWKTVRKALALQCPTAVEVDGEEDLLAIPALFFAPENAVVVYGQPGEGAVLMQADRENKDFVENLLELDRSEHLIVGGSWDMFHSGHRYILSTAVERSEHLDLGVTSDKMLTEKIGSKEHDSFEERADNIRKFLRSHGKEDFNIIEINDIYGNAVENGDRLLVSPEKRKNAQKINEKRREGAREPLDIDVIDKLEAEDGELISCSRIRAGEIDLNGKTTN